jgi:hypothetical protein
VWGGVNASGCGGGGGHYIYGPGYADPSAGGGSGGTIVIESPRVSLGANAEMLAAGGGGGWYIADPDLNSDGGIPAEPFGPGASLAIGDLTGNFYASSCPGFQGPGGGSTPTNLAGGAGGIDYQSYCAGGGAAGQIAILASNGTVPEPTTVIFSPNQSSGGVIVGSIQAR